MIKKYLIGIIGGILAIIGVFYKGKKAGKQQEQFNQLKATEKNVKKARDVRDNITDDDRDRMRKKYKRR